MFRTVPLYIVRSFSLYTQQWYMSYSLRAGSGRNPFWSCSQAVSKPLWHIPSLCVQWKTPDDGQRNCPKHVEFYSKNKWEISATSWFYYKNLSAILNVLTGPILHWMLYWSILDTVQHFSLFLSGNTNICSANIVIWGLSWPERHTHTQSCVAYRLGYVLRNASLGDFVVVQRS